MFLTARMDSIRYVLTSDYSQFLICMQRKVSLTVCSPQLLSTHLEEADPTVYNILQKVRPGIVMTRDDVKDACRRKDDRNISST
jgi:hypothetical protein